MSLTDVECVRRKSLQFLAKDFVYDMFLVRANFPNGSLVPDILGKNKSDIQFASYETQIFRI